MLIIDIETYIYKAIAASKTLVKVDEDIYTEGYDLKQGYEWLSEQLDLLLSYTNHHNYVLAIGDEVNFRKIINSHYKAQRKAKPVVYPQFVQMLYDKDEPIITMKYLEADDVCRILYEDEDFAPDEEKIIVSIDKDFYSVPCNFYRDLDPDWHLGIQHITEEQAEQNLLKQIAVGDKADNYKGVVTELGYKKFLSQLDRRPNFDDIIDLFISKGLTVEDAVLNRQMAEIIDINHYNCMTNEVQYYEL